MSIVGNSVVLGEGGETASIRVTGVSQTDTMTCVKDGKSYKGKWVSIPNPAYHGLPDGYTELEYIESTGTQYLDMGYSTTNAATLAKLSFEVTCSYYDIQTGSTDELLNGNGNAYLGFINGKFYAAWGRSAGILIDDNIVSDNLMHTWLADVDAKIIKFDDTIVESNANFTGLANNYGTLYLFGYQPSAIDNCRIAGSKLKYNGAYIRNYIPCKRNSDGAIGMYDLVTETFFGNSGSGEFIGGEEIPSTVDCWEFTVNSYGTYTITANNGSKAQSKNVLVDSADLFSVEIDYKLWLYRNGDECKDVTGGWDGEAAEWSSEVKGQFSVYKRDTYLECYGNNGAGSCFFTTANPIDVTNYTQLHFVSKRSNSSGGSKMQTSTTKPYYSTGNYLPARTDVLSADFPSTEKEEAVLDVSEISGEVYVFMLISGYTSYLYEVWLE